MARRTQSKPEKTEQREPNDREAKAISTATARRGTRSGRAQYDQLPDKDGVMRLQSKHSDENGHSILIAETFATTADDFVGASLLGLAKCTSQGGKQSLEGLNASLALIGAIQPIDELEAALATQIAATHDLAMEMMNRTKNATTRDSMRDYGNLATKFQRTLATQIKALSDWRRGGEQVVRHVHVYPGGQAVVAGTFNAGGYGNEKTSGQVHDQGAVGTEMLGYDPAGHGLPVSGDQGQEAVPAPRREIDRRSEG